MTKTNLLLSVALAALAAQAGLAAEARNADTNAPGWLTQPLSLVAR